MKVALVHDWLTGMRGGERVLERIAGLFPAAPIFTLVWKRGALSRAIEAHPIHTSWLQRLPGAGTRYRWFLPLYPDAIERFDLSEFDVVLSTSHAVAKSVVTRSTAFHLSYVFTPMRYIWELEDDYFPPGRFPWPLSAYVRHVCASLRRWDVATSDRATVMIADSRHVAARILRRYGRDAAVIYPPVEVEGLAAGTGERDYYLLAGAFAPYKRGELAIEACRRLGRRLIVTGSGQDESRLRDRAGPEVEFRGWVSDASLVELLRGARALLFPGEEDFGILPVEAMACGCPVIALGRGGAVETVGRGTDPATLAAVSAGGSVRVPGGVLFAPQTADVLVEAIRTFEGESFDPRLLHELARPFDSARFDREYLAAIDAGLAATHGSRPGGAPIEASPPALAATSPAAIGGAP